MEKILNIKFFKNIIIKYASVKMNHSPSSKYTLKTYIMFKKIIVKYNPFKKEWEIKKNGGNCNE